MGSSSHQQKSSFGVSIKLNAQESACRLQARLRESMPSLWRARVLVAPVDPDGVLFTALVGLREEVKGACRELALPTGSECTYLANGVLAAERVLAQTKALLRFLAAAGDHVLWYEGVALRADCLRGEIDTACDALEEMRAWYGKELAGKQRGGQGEKVKGRWLSLKLRKVTVGDQRPVGEYVYSKSRGTSAPPP
jgi:hypothetical protein